MEHAEEKSISETKSKEELELVKEQEGCSTKSESSALCASAISDLAGSSSYRDKLQKGFSNRYGMPLGSEELKPLITNQNTEGLGGVSASVSSSNETAGINHKQKGLWQNFFQLAGGIRSRDSSGVSVSQKKGGILISSKEDKGMESVGNEELKPLIAKQKNKGLGRGSAYLGDGCHTLTHSNRQPGSDDRSKVLRSSSFTNFFMKQSRKDKAVECANPEFHYELHSAVNTQFEKESSPLSVQNSDMLVGTKASKVQPSSPVLDLVGPVRSHGRITLREWLNSGASGIRKVERLYLFRLIVELVDLAHCDGIGLLDLRPSKFIFASPNSIKYTGSSTPVGFMTTVDQGLTKERAFERDMHDQRELLVKKQKIGKDMESIRHQSQFISKYFFVDEITARSEPEIFQLEKKWYACPEELHGSGLLSSNIYNLGILLFEVGHLLKYFVLWSLLCNPYSNFCTKLPFISSLMLFS